MLSSPMRLVRGMKPRRSRRIPAWALIMLTHGVLFQFGGCLADVLVDVFFAVGPWLL